MTTRRATWHLVESALQSAADGIGLTDDRGIVVFVNAALERMSGYARAELLGQPLELLLPESQSADPRIDRVVHGRQSTEQARALVVRRKDGTEIPVEISLSPFEASGRRFVVAIMRDVSAQRWLLKALRQSERAAVAAATEAERAHAELRALVEASPVGVVVVDRDSDVTLVNDEALRITGLDAPPASLRELVNRVACTRSDGEPRPPAEFPLERALRTGDRTDAEEVTFALQRGRTLVAVVNASPVRDVHGEQVGAVAILNDVSELARVRASREVFVDMVRHELANPLTVLLGMARRGLVDPGPDAALVREILEDVVAQGEIIRSLVEHLSDLEGIDRGHFSVIPEAVVLPALVREVLRSFAEITGRACDLEARVPDDMPPIDADPLRLKQVLTNLLINAAKYSEPGTRISLDASLRGGEVRISIADQGLGIAAPDFNRLFEPFSRLTAAAGVRGLGLGLAISRAIVEAHGGRIWVESEGRGHGTTFTIALPIRAPVQAEGGARRGSGRRRAEAAGRPPRPREE